MRQGKPNITRETLTHRLGACGITNTDADLICAIGHDLFDSIPAPGNNPNKSPFCNRQIKATIGEITLYLINMF